MLCCSRSCMSKAGLFLPPEVTVASVNVTGVSLRGVSIACHFQVSNPNSAELNVHHIEYLITKCSNGILLSEGVWEPAAASGGKGVVLPANAKNVKLKPPMPLQLAYSGIVAAGESMVHRGRTEIQASGKIYFQADYVPGGVIGIPYKINTEIVVAGTSKDNNHGKQ